MKEIWKPVVGFEDKYRVSNLGRVKSLLHFYPEGRILKLRIGSVGYPVVELQGKEHRVHSLVTAAFLGPRPEGQQVRHLDGNPKNAALANLKYGTPKENSEDAARHGTQPRGEKHGKTSLKTIDVINIRAVYGRLSLNQLARAYEVDMATIWRIVRRKVWTHV